MCGIAGALSVDQKNLSRSSLLAMTESIAHRGPDGSGIWINNDGTVGLGHRRLSIIDLTNAGHQPIHYLNRYTIVFNGEIYNYLELKQNLKKRGYSFKSDSDTEVLLALYDQMGVNCLKELDGMFAFAIWDSQEKNLFCARDRFGEKPFYYSVINNTLYFASEMKALWAIGIPKVPDQEMLFYYLEYGYVHHPFSRSKTFYTGIKKLPASHYFKLDLNNIVPAPIQYWDIDYDFATKNIYSKEEDNIEHFLNLLETSVARRLRSDVPVGSSLSGGLDSSAIVCLINKIKKGTGQNQNTFSARFLGYKKDEGDFMNLIIQHTNVIPHFTFPDVHGFIDSFDKLVYHQEEPFASTSIYAQYSVMKLASENNVIVLLDGQGADELIAGYPQYYQTYFGELKTDKLFDKLNSEKNAYDKLIGQQYGLSKDWRKYIVHTFPQVFAFGKSVYKKILHNKLYTVESRKAIADLNIPQTQHRKLNNHLKSDIQDGNLENLLRYCDRNSMAHSREVRLPFLSHELAEFVFALPAEYKIKDGWTKWIQRMAIAPFVPSRITWRKDKIGYEPPQEDWVKNKKLEMLIMDGKEVMYKHRFITKAESQKRPGISSATGSYDKSWTYLMAAQLFK